MHKNFTIKNTFEVKYKAFAGSICAFIAAMVLGLVVSSVLAPVKGADAATDQTDTPGGHSVTVTSADSLVLNLTSTPDGALASVTDNLSIKSDAPNGYQLYISMSASGDGASRLVNSADSSSFYSPAPGTFTSPAALGMNTWGYAIPSGTSGAPETIAFDDDYSIVSRSSTFAAVPASDNADLLQSTSAPTEEDETVDITYALLSNTAQAAGAYTGTITYTITADDPAPPVEIAEYMQDFTGEMCESLDVDKTITLKDRRDEKEYTVIHAQDGNCWMTQNLSLINQKIYAEDSDFPSGSFTVPASSTWNSNITNAARVHQATTSGYTDQVYYNWYSATAGSTLSTDGASSYTSICPRGWTLPVNGGSSTNKSVAKLFEAYGIDTAEKTVSNDALNFTYAGMWSFVQNRELNQGTGTGIWYSTVKSGSVAYHLTSHKSEGFNVSAASSHGSGLSIRCVFNADTTMQDFSAKMCNDMTTNTSVTLQDRRNLASYRVVKAADGNCWMADNLMLGSATEETVIKAEDSNFTSGTFTIPASSTWDSNVYTEPRLHVATNSGYEGTYYYNWTATVALSNSSNDVQQNQSICPKGWRLPINGDANQDKSYAKLMNTYGATTGPNLLNPSHASYVLGFTRYWGYWSYESVNEHNQSLASYFWSSTPSSSTNARYLHYDTNGLHPQYSHEKGRGMVVRCVFEGETIQDITYMQDMTKAICDATNTGVTARLRDKRGRGNAGSAEDDSYGVIKAKDGNCWMTENFDLYNMTGDNAIKAEDSDFTSGTYEIPASSNWSGNTYTEPLVHQATNSGYEDQVYYSWTTAMALNNGSTTSVQDQSICPAGWQVPLNGNNSTNKTWSKLMNAYGATTGANLVNPNHASYPLGFRYFGSYSYAHGEYLQGSYGYFWSSAPENASYAYRPIYIDSAITTQNSSSGKDNGFSMRCVSRD